MKIVHLKGEPAVTKEVVVSPAVAERFVLDVSKQELDVLRHLCGSVSGRNAFRNAVDGMYEQLSKHSEVKQAGVVINGERFEVFMNVKSHGYVNQKEEEDAKSPYVTPKRGCSG